jgi:hypothetical protein
MESSQSLYFYSFNRVRSLTKTGDGEKCLREVCRLADKLGVTIVLWTSVDKLRVMYERHDFKFTRLDHNKVWMWMKREPK